MIKVQVRSHKEHEVVRRGRRDHDGGRGYRHVLGGRVESAARAQVWTGHGNLIRAFACYDAPQCFDLIGIGQAWPLGRAVPIISFGGAGGLESRQLQTCMAAQHQVTRYGTAILRWSVPSEQELAPFDFNGQVTGRGGNRGYVDCRSIAALDPCGVDQERGNRSGEANHRNGKGQRQRHPGQSKHVTIQDEVCRDFLDSLSNGQLPMSA